MIDLKAASETNSPSAVGLIGSSDGLAAARSLGLLPPKQSGFMSYVGELLGVPSSGFGNSGLVNSASVESAAIPSELLGLLELQRQMQIEMESVSLISNIEKSRHESKMAAIRNVKTN